MAPASADVVEVVVLAAGADALLRVRDAPPRGALLAEEVRLELVHAGVRKQQRRVLMRDDGRGRHERVAVPLHEEVDELPANLVRRHMNAFLEARGRVAGRGAIIEKDCRRSSMRDGPKQNVPGHWRWTRDVASYLG
jgi:hypothetical protein